MSETMDFLPTGNNGPPNPRHVAFDDFDSDLKDYDDFVRMNPVSEEKKKHPEKQRSYIPPTRFAQAYKSIFIQKPESEKVKDIVPYVNCSYLSTTSKIPTLLELKQHAQSLVILIKSITMAEQGGLIDNENSGIMGAHPFSDGLTFDFLNNLREPYAGPKNPALMAAHQKQLTSLANVITSGWQPMPEHKDQYGNISPPANTVIIQDVCPLHHVEDSVDNTTYGQPYATHQALIAHANEVLEMIDHEYSAVGGLLGILPKVEQKEQRAKAESTLLGQLILYVTRLVQRIHDLERLYANALDCLATESVVPHQALSALGPDGRKPREIVYPQDRFVLVNAGDSVWEYLNSEFEYREEIDGRVAANYKKHGLAGEAIWEQRGGKEMSRGITAIDITTRYYRLRGDPLKTIFVIPAHSEHPGTKVTRKMENEPTVVAVVKPVWPERISEWEKKHRAELEELKVLRNQFRASQSEVEQARHRVTVMDGIHDQLKKRNAFLETALITEPHVHTAQLLEASEKLQADREELDTERARLKEVLDSNAREWTEIDEIRNKLDEERAQFYQEQQEKKQKNDEAAAARIEKLEIMDAERATAAQELADKLATEWREELKKVLDLKRLLERYQVAINLDALIPTGTTKERQKTIDDLVASDERIEAAKQKIQRLSDEAKKKADDGDAAMGGI
ncbi:hypothetical protein ONS95_011239 [Cadophora gregata]|uniref:uncharacterized protein n=1 Tax=Cadophora gregata TaxID=51156 RepID=UPI0026DA8F03|nr:uncharacterized protein ONS95_011239 [Cadophora gregata]KAK0119807.1 hypothetical protein ONS95_011239 [Cadophora gregata]KAK0120840.1 hypothetical protein ONS96_011041 [Cadophora gregata f. sp. sojae]